MRRSGRARRSGASSSGEIQEGDLSPPQQAPAAAGAAAAAGPGPGPPAAAGVGRWCSETCCQLAEAARAAAGYAESHPAEVAVGGTLGALLLYAAYRERQAIAR